MQRFIVGSLMVIALLVAPMSGFAKDIKVEGTIQGLLCTLNGLTCPVGEEDVIAAVEDTFILVADDGDWYLMPNVKSALAAKYLNKTVRVIGQKAMGGQAINVSSADVLEDGEWRTIYDPAMAQKAKDREDRMRKVIQSNLTWGSKSAKDTKSSR